MGLWGRKDDASLAERVAADMVRLFGAGSVEALRGNAANSDAWGDAFSANTWQNIADQAERLIARQSQTSGVRQAGDWLIASVLLALMLPLLIVVAVLLKLERAGPVLVWRPETGIQGRVISAPRFRTGAGHEATRLERFISYGRIDTLPQLLSVLDGRMSIIGDERERPRFLRSSPSA